jgi:hypothetical protein
MLLRLSKISTEYAAEQAMQLPADWRDDHSEHVYEVRPPKDKRGIDLNSDVLPFGRLL